MAIEQALEVQRRIEKESNQHDTLVDAFNQSKTSEIEEMIYEDEALIINESVNDLNEESKVRLDHSFVNLETLINDDQLMINQLLQELNTGRISRNYLQLSQCTPDLNGLCFGHFSRDFSDNDFSKSCLSSIIDPMDHSLIEISQTNGVEYKIGIRNSILLQCPETNPQKFFSNMVVDLFDPNQNKVEITLKERVKNSKRIVKIDFEPLMHGQHRFTVVYQGCHIHGSPFFFHVSPNTLADPSTLNTTNICTTNSVESITLQGSRLKFTFIICF